MQLMLKPVTHLFLYSAISYKGNRELLVILLHQLDHRRKKSGKKTPIGKGGQMALIRENPKT